MKRIVGRRIVDDSEKTAIVVIVKKRWFSDYFFHEEQIGVTISEGILKIDLGVEIRSYAAGKWARVISKRAQSRNRV